MEKRCEFCLTASPIVYCKADAAHLCLSCDAKVHSANALSYRHPRTLVCQSCGLGPTSVRCLDHHAFMCHECDASHDVSFGHQRRVVGCYVGCPSARDLAALWGLGSTNWENHFLEFEEGSSSKGTKAAKGENWPQNSRIILQQIHELEKTQVSKGIFDNSTLPHVRERMSKLDSIWKLRGDHFGSDIDLENSPETKTDEASPFSQLETFSNAIINQVDSFWPNNEIWLHNMQDLGVCNEVRCFDSIDIPDVDLTFRNFEEIFGNENEISIGDAPENMSCSFGELDRSCASTLEEIAGPYREKVDASDEARNLDSNDKISSLMKSSVSASSFSVSRITGENRGSSTFQKQRLCSYDSKNTRLEAKENVKTRCKEKKDTRHGKQAKYTPPKLVLGSKKLEKGRSIKIHEETTNVTQRDSERYIS